MFFILLCNLLLHMLKLMANQWPLNWEISNWNAYPLSSNWKNGRQEIKWLIKSIRLPVQEVDKPYAILQDPDMLWVMGYKSIPGQLSSFH